MSRQISHKEQSVYARIRQIIDSARGRIVHTINFEMVQAYWLVGKEIVEEEQKGARRASYGVGLLVSLARKLTSDYGSGFDQSNLRNIRQFYLSFPIRDALRRELSWTHYRLLMRVTPPNARHIFASKYKLYLPTEKELREELKGVDRHI